LIAAFKELRFKGGRCATVDLILSIVLGVLLALLESHGILTDLVGLLDVGHDQNTSKYLYVLYGGVLAFFFFSVCLVAAQDRFSAKMRSKFQKK